MLSRRPGAPLSRLLLVALALPLVAVGLVTAAGPASAEDCAPYVDGNGDVVYPCERDGSTQPGRDGRDGSNAGNDTTPSCDLVSPATFCLGSKPCYIKESVVPFAPPKSAPPKPDAEWVVRLCLNAGGTWGGEAIWLTDALPVEPPLIVQAAEAVGRLRLPEIDFETNPPVRSIVNIETRFTAAGDVADPVEGSSSFGLVAIATLDTWHIVTGDGVTLSCSVAQLGSGACAHVYQRASVGQSQRDEAGQPAYPVRSYGTWTIAYEDGGDPVDIPGAVATLDGPSTTVPVAVAEIQSVVSGSG